MKSIKSKIRRLNYNCERGVKWKLTPTLSERTCYTKYNRGSIIIFTLLILSAILAMTLTLTKIFIPRIRTITEATNSIGALYAADSAMEWCLYNNREKSPLLVQPVMANGASYQIYRNNSLSVCPVGETLNYRTVGKFRGVSRSFEVSEL